ncbi:uncharacterized protein [Argopecten irradians]|uniref:uncharacterized protein n=1 Tax=Argopecten irradians TaxID=31199 RepID=UPI00371B3827
MEVNRFDYLWRNTEWYRDKVLEASFVKGIKDGSLDPIAFGGFVIQDCIYLYEQYKCIEVAKEATKDADLKKILTKLMEKYKGYYEAAFKLWHIDNPSTIKLGPACQKYVEYMRKASTMDTIYFLVSMTPCMSLWAWLGQEIKRTNHGVYTQWVNSNFVGGEVLEDLKQKIDTYRYFDYGTAIHLFRDALENEFDFFNSVGK